MSKSQKIWLWVFGAMFLIPEILFLNISSFVALFLGKNIPNTISLFMGGNYSLDPAQFFMIMAIEFIGALGLFIISIKNKWKIIAAILGVILLIIILISGLVYKLSQMNPIL